MSGWEERKAVAVVLLRWVGLACIIVTLAGMALVGPEGFGAFLFSLVLLLGELFDLIRVNR